MSSVKFYSNVDDSLLKFAVIVLRYNSSWVFWKHRECSTYEVPGGHRENGEDIFTTVKRELWEETGAVDYSLTPICVYSVVDDTAETFSMLYYAEIKRFEHLPQLEIEKVEFFHDLPDFWTYPDTQPFLIEKIKQTIKI